MSEHATNSRTQSGTQTSALYRAIHAMPQTVRSLLGDWAGPTQAAHHLHTRERVLLAGIGTSYHAALVGEYLLHLAGVDAWAVRSYEFVTYPRPLQPSDGIIVISHRGSKVFGQGTVQRAMQAGTFTIGITGKHSSMRDVDVLLETVEQEVSSTHSISYIGTLVRLAQVATRLAELRGSIEAARKLEQGLLALPAQIEHLLLREDAIQRVAQDVVAQQRRVVVIGAGPNAATAPEGALKAKEAAYITIEGLELEQAIHGPFVAFEAHDLIIPISVQGPAQPRIADLLRALHTLDTHVFLLGEPPTAETTNLFTHTGWSSFPLTNNEAVQEELTPLLAVVPLQLFADFLATARGTNADSFRKDQAQYKQAAEQYQL